MACVAIVSIRQGAHSCPFRVGDINASSLREGRGNVKINFPLQVGLTPTGEMQPVTPVIGIFWPKLIDIASDCHEQNVKLCHWNNKDTLVLQAIRDIPAGQRLQLWFSNDLMISELGIPPYLSPLNIKGGNSYVCHECHEEFERPNLLKLHLALHCDRLSPETIWNRLRPMGSSQVLINSSYLVNLNPGQVSLQSVTSSSYPLLTISPSLPPMVTSSTPPPLRLPSSHQHELVSTSNTRRHHNNNKGSAASSTVSSPSIDIEAPVEVQTPPALAEPETNGRSLVVQEQHHHHARLEAIVSNMGKAKNGHVCLYCGKLYSRKYGLKIHIRTHTGYKPLRCKICHRPFGDPSNLNKHVRLHSDGSTPYRCDLCSKVLVRRRDLDRHMRSRHGNSGQETGRGGSNGITFQQQQCSNSNRNSTVTSTVCTNSNSML